MKNMKYLVVAASWCLLTTACSDFLDREPYNSLSPGTYWNTESDLQMAVNPLYTKLMTGRDYNEDVKSADCYGQTPNNVSSGTYTPVNVDEVWKECYKQIRICNQFFENYQKAHVSESAKKRYAAEAHFFRAYYYYVLITRFGDVPQVLQTLDITSPELYGPREKKETILKMIEEDLTFAETYLPQQKDLKETEYGRLTRGAAQAFASRVYLYFGTWYKFRNESELGMTYLNLAKEASGRCMSEGQYELYTDYRNLFLYPGEKSSEHILSRVFDESVPNEYNFRIRKVILDQYQEPTKYLADAFLCKDGLPIGKSRYQVEYLPAGKEFENRDPRMTYSLWQPGTDYRGLPFVPNFTNQTNTGYMFRKYGDEASFENMRSYIDEIIIRYAEVLLNYAEAVYELSETISDDDLDKSINLLRARFEGHADRLPDLTNDFVNTHGLNMREEIRRERRVELCSESFRYADLIRWKTAELELPKDILGVKFDPMMYPDIVPNVDINLNEDGFVVVQAGNTRSFSPLKDYLFPLPLRELSLNTSLKQNPGW